MPKHLFQKGNIPQMVEALKYLLDQPTERQRMGTENVTLAKRFTWEKFTDQLLLLYDELQHTQKKE